MQVLDKILNFNQITKDNIKITLMKENSFAFFRGTSHLFFEHLYTIVDKNFINNKDLLCWIQGDAHIGNVGFSNKKCSSIKDIKFEINDFDESFIGNPILDIIRFCVSIGFFFDNFNNTQKESLRDTGFIYKDTIMIEYFMKKYFKFIVDEKDIKYKWKKSKFMSNMAKKAQKRVDTNHPKSKINKFTKIKDNQRVFDFSNPKIKPLKNKTKLISKLQENLGYKVLDVCIRKTAGVGSAHLQRYYMLTQKNNQTLLLEIKEQILPSFLNYFENNKQYLEHKKASQIHIKAKQKMLKDYDLHLNSFEYENKDFLIKSIFNAKYSVDGEMFIKDNIENFDKNLKEYLEFCAISLSNAHKNSAQNKNKFIKEMRKIKKKRFFRIETMTLKSYATNLMFYSHFVRDLEINVNNK
jgi:hypothetical protein